jgi:hypothetical protein
MRRFANCTRMRTDRPSPHGEEDESLFREVFPAVEDFLGPAERAELLSAFSRFDAAEGEAGIPATDTALIKRLAHEAERKGAGPWRTSTKGPRTPTATEDPPRRS